MFHLLSWSNQLRIISNQSMQCIDYLHSKPLLSEEMFVIVCTGLTGARRRREDPSSSNVIWHWAFPAQETTDYAATSCYRYYYNYYTITTGAFFRGVERRGLSPKLLVWPLPPPRQLTLESTLPISLATAAAKASSNNLLFFHARWGLIMLINVSHHDTMCFTTALFTLWKVIR